MKSKQRKMQGFKPTFRGRRGGRNDKRRDFQSKSNIKFKYDKNQYIRSAQVVLINSAGENVGVVNTSEALAMAQREGLDLIEVAPNTNPPVAKIMSWSKFLYDQKKKEKQSRKNKQKELKELRFGTFIAGGDRERILTRAQEFLDEGHNVRLTVTKRGRISIEESKKLMRELLTALSEYSTIDSEPSVQGNKVSIVIKGKLAKQKNAKTENKQNSIKEVQKDKPEGGSQVKTDVQQKPPRTPKN